MHSNSFIAGIVTAGMVLAAWHYRAAFLDAPAEPSSPPIAAAASKAPAPAPPRLTRPAPNTDIEVQSSYTVSLPYGKIQLPVGTRVTVVSETPTGIVGKVGKFPVDLPLSIFQPPVEPAPPMPLSAPLPSGAPIALDKANPAGLARFARSLLVVKGDESLGSASVITIRGVPRIVTNAHVLSGNHTFSIRSLDAREIPTSSLTLSQDYDLATLAAKQLPPALPIVENVDKEVTIGDQVLVLGNSQGSEVVTEIPGKVTGIGPDLVEVDAKFVEGNSGSPIIQVKSGKVIAIATFATVRKLSDLATDSQFTEVRRFGYRLDTANRWQPARWAQFASEAETLGRLRRNTDYLVKVIIDIYRNHALSLDAHQAPNNPARTYVTDYLRLIDGPTTLSRQDIATAKIRFFRGMIFLTRQGFLDYEPQSAFHRREADEELADRAFLRDKFTELMNIQDTDRRIKLP